MPQPILGKSQRSTTTAFVRFINRTQHTWLDFHDVPIVYRTVKPNKCLDIYVTTKDRMCALRHKILYTEPW